jgi:cholesterol transport system auxiliary component
VAEPVALQAFGSNRIVVKSSDGTISFLGGAQWSDQQPALLQSRIVQTFENYGRAVGRSGNGVAADVVLQSDIRFFGVKAGEGAAIELSAKLVDGESGRILAARIFRSGAPIAGSAGPGAAAAIDGAMVRVLDELVRWAIGARLGPPRPPVAAAPPPATAPAGPT